MITNQRMNKIMINFFERLWILFFLLKLVWRFNCFFEKKKNQKLYNYLWWQQKNYSDYFRLIKKYKKIKNIKKN